MKNLKYLTASGSQFWCSSRHRVTGCGQLWPVQPVSWSCEAVWVLLQCMHQRKISANRNLQVHWFLRSSALSWRFSPHQRRNPRPLQTISKNDKGHTLAGQEVRFYFVVFSPHNAKMIVVRFAPANALPYLPGKTDSRIRSTTDFNQRLKTSRHQQALTFLLLKYISDLRPWLERKQTEILCNQRT